MQVAIGFALDKTKEDEQPVLFVIGCQNYRGPMGILMNNESFTSYPAEGEILLQEGCAVYILAINRDRQIKNSYKGMEKYNGKSITIVHLFHDSWDKKNKY